MTLSFDRDSRSDSGYASTYRWAFECSARCIGVRHATVVESLPASGTW